MSFVADYEIREWLAPGNHGDWWLATPPKRLGHGSPHVALKALWKDATDLDFDRMVRELRILNDVSSPHLVRLIEAGETDGRLFYVRAHYVDGSLENLPAGDARALTAVATAARGAHDLHQHGVAHRDIKPSTILLDGPRGILSELGLAQQIQPGMTTGIGPVGAMDYVAPEVALGERGSAASDVWALAVVLHKVVTGQSIYGDTPVDNVLDGYRRVTAGNWSLSDYLSDPLRDILHRCLARQPDERLGSALELAHALEAQQMMKSPAYRLPPGGTHDE